MKFYSALSILMMTFACSTSTSVEPVSDAAADVDNPDSAAVQPPGPDAAVPPPVPDAAAPPDGGVDSATDASIVADANAADAGSIFPPIYEAILVPRCLSCHSTSEPGVLYFGGVRETYDALLAPVARCGSPVVPFDLESSEIMYIDEDLPCDGLRHGARMDASYTAEERTADLATIEDWILAGARY